MSIWIEDLEGFKIKSEYINNVDLNFFKSHGAVTRLAVIYGRNGSGKTTITSCIENFAHGVAYPTAEPILKGGVKNLEGDVKICVFNNDYINKNVKFVERDKCGLRPIVLFGAQIELEEKIKKYENDLNCETLKLTDLIQKENEYLAKKGVTSLEEVKVEINKVLRRRWYGIRFKYTGKNVSIRDSQFKDFVLSDSAKALENEECRLREFEDAQIKYAKLEAELDISDKVSIFQKISNLPNFDIEARELKVLCEKVLSNVDLTNREKRIKEEIGTAQLVLAKKFMKGGAQLCPTCLRAINDQVRLEALSIIDRILNEEVNDFLQKLQNCRADQIEIRDVDLWAKIDPVRICEFNDILNLANNFIQKHNQFIEKKVNSLDVVILDYPYEEYERLTEKFTQVKTGLLNAKSRVVDQARTIADLKLDLLRENDRIARCEISELASGYRRLKDAYDDIVKNISSVRQKIDNIKKYIRELKARQRNVEIAIDEINKILKLVYGDSKRLFVSLGSDGDYHLNARGHRVRPSELSTGEQNVIALAYFFLSIAEDQSAQYLYGNPYLIVVDDPVSSFDYEVRLGVYSFICSQLMKILEGNNKTKILITTHDSVASFALFKFFKPLKFSVFWELENQCLTEIKKAEVGEYENLLLTAYEYAKSIKTEIVGIDNILRRILESASTYHFKKGFNEVDFTGEVFAGVSESLLNQFEKLKIVLMLNYESHLRSQISMNPDWLTSLTQFQEKSRVAKVVMCFLYVIGKSHVISFLKNAHPDVESVMQTWMTDMGS